MKELSIEEKAKAYDKVAKEVKDFFEGKQKMYSDVTQTLEYLFPKLKESEDERIRKALIDGFTVMKESKNCSKTFSNHNIPVVDILAWLEKRGEPQVRTGLKWVNTIDDACDKRYSEEYAHGEYCHEQSFKWGFQEGVDWLEKQGEQKLPIEKLPFEMKTLSESLGFTTQKECDDYNKMVTDLIMSDDDNGEQKELKKEKVDNLHNYLYGEQKPAWSEEDKKMIEAIEALCDDKIRFTEFHDVKEYAYTIKNWLKSLKYSVRPQLKQEWSEEDEETLKDIITLITNLKDSATSDALRYIYNSKIDWLKSLKERCTWKPSDEQMEALRKAEATIGVNHVVLAGLISDLEKLKG